MRICFVGHDFHRRTGSSRFMVDLLGTVGEVIEFYGNPDGSPQVNDAITRELASSSFDRYVYWQSELIAERLLPLQLGPSFIAPMYDTVATKRDSWWLQFVDHAFLSFTRAHHERLQRIACRSYNFQYFPDPGPEPFRWVGDDRSGFFWARQPRSNINSRRVLALCHALGIGRLHIHDVPDFAVDREELLSPDADGIDITVSNWFERREEFDAVAGASLFYFAPRPLEGIGMASLEAMARGQIVVAPDLAATNEYVASGVSGLLYDPTQDACADMPRLSANELHRMGLAARRKVVEGRRTWLTDSERLLSIVAGDGRRWSTFDASAGFGHLIRQAAHNRRLAS